MSKKINNSTKNTEQNKSKNNKPEVNIKNNNFPEIGILDTKGVNNNPFTNEPYKNLYSSDRDKPGTYAELFDKYWKILPVWTNRLKIIKTIRDNQVILLTSGTGSGKTVLVPPLALYTVGYEYKIAVTVPKRLLAQKSARTASKLSDVELGKQIGYKYRGSPDSSHSGDTKLLFTTDGSIVAQLLGDDPDLRKYKCIIIDEAHERSIQIDYLLYLLKGVLERRDDFKIIIMSAKMALDDFRKYFPSDRFKFAEIDAGEGNTYPVEDIYLDHPHVGNYTQLIANKTAEVIKSFQDDPEKKGDFINFVLAGSDGIKACIALNEKIKMEKLPKTYCAELSAATPKDEEELRTSPSLYKNSEGGPYDVKVVMTTNVAESSITIDGSKYVVDSGIEKYSSYDPIRMLKSLQDRHISKAQVLQRRGRVGRTQPGTCYHLYTKDEYDDDNIFPEYPTPAILRSDISGDLLNLLKSPEVMGSVSKLFILLNQLISKPKDDYIKSALRKLVGLGVIESTKGKKATNVSIKNKDDMVLTTIGSRMASMGGSTPENSRMILRGYDLNCSKEMCELAAMLDESSGKLDSILMDFRTKTKDEKKVEKERDEFNERRRKLSHRYGDFLTLIYVYQKFRIIMKEKGKSAAKEWCKDNFIKYKILERVENTSRKFYDQLRRSLRSEEKQKTITDKNEKLKEESKNFAEILESNAISSDDGIKTVGEEKIVGDVKDHYGGDVPINKNNRRMPKYEKQEDKYADCILHGYFLNMATNIRKKTYENCFPEENSSADLEKNSSLNYFKEVPKNLIYYEMADINGRRKLNISGRIPTKVMENLDKKNKDNIEGCFKMRKNSGTGRLIPRKANKQRTFVPKKIKLL